MNKNKIESNSPEKIVKISEAPKWVVDNEYLRNGYRKGFNTISKAVKSGFMKHNELMNIWTHLIGALIFLAILINSGHHHPKMFKMRPFDQSKLLFHEQTKLYFSKFKSDLIPFFRNLKRANMKITKSNVKALLSHSRTKLSNFNEKYVNSFKKVKKIIRENELKVIDFFGKNCSRYFNLLNLLRLKILEKAKKSMELENMLKPEANFSKVKDCVDNLLHLVDTFLPSTEQINSLFSRESIDLETYPFLVYICCVIFCLLSSGIYHWFYTISETINKCLLKLDLAGISILNFGSSFGHYFYFFYCMPRIRNIYCTAVFVFSIMAFICSMSDKMRKQKYKKIKAVMYAGMGLANVVPLVHLIYLCCLASPENDHLPFNASFFWIGMTGFFYLMGLVIYTTHFPEKVFPDTFDIWFNSHTIWHIFVFFAALSCYFGIKAVYQTRLQHICI